MKTGFKIKNLLIAIFLLILTSCTLTKAVYYFTANIDDYKIFKNREVKAGNYEEWDIADNYNNYEIPDKYKSEIKELETVAYLVVHKDKILFEEYWDDYDKETLSNSFSMAKSFTSLLIGLAIEDGYIKSVDQKVSEIIKEYNTETNKYLTIKDVLTMSSGLEWKERYASPFSHTTKAYYGRNLEKLVLKLDVIEEPGKKFKYLSGSTQLLALIVERATGKKISDYFSEKIWTKIGAKQDALWSLDKKDGTEKAYCCFNSTARGFGRIGKLIINGGKWNGKQIIPANYLKESLEPADHLTIGDKQVTFYGYQWWMMNYKNINIKFARGLYGQYIFIIPEKDLVVVRLGHKRSKTYKNYMPSDVFTWIDMALEMINKKEK